MGEWSPSNFPAWLRKVNKALGRLDRVTVGAANKADDAQATATGAAQTADGKNTVNWEFIAPDMPGTNDGDLWYVLDSSTNAAVGFYRWDANAQQWVAGPLDGSILTNVTAAHIVAGAIDGQVITGVTFRSAASGARVEISGTSIRIYNDANQVIGIIDGTGGGQGGNYLTVGGIGNNFTRLGSPTTNSGRNVGVYTSSVEATNFYGGTFAMANGQTVIGTRTDGNPFLTAWGLAMRDNIIFGVETSYLIGPDGTTVLGATTLDSLQVLGSISGLVRLSATGDLSPTSTGHAFQIGPTSGANLAMDQNEIMARNNGAVSSLFIQTDGGNVGIGNADSTITIQGLINNTYLPLREAVGDATLTAAVAVGNNGAVNVTFPAGRFTQPPRVFVTPSNNRVTCNASNVTTTGCTLNASNWSNNSMPANTVLSYHAIQMTGSSATG